MKILVTMLLFASLAAPAAVGAQSEDRGGDDMMRGPDAGARAATHKGAGTVIRVDPAAGKVTIAHGPIPTLKWPAMTMNFVIGNKALLRKLSPGKKIEFEFVQRGSDYVITSAR
jgi:Cu/Ag efflux protein CusF